VYISEYFVRELQDRHSDLTKIFYLLSAYRILVGKPEGKRQDQDVGGWIILK
jgi:hypothetical protein